MLYARYARVILLRCRALTGNHADADEVLQETFLRAWRSGVSFEADRPLGWLHRTAHNASIDILRRRKRHAIPSEQIEQLASAIAPAGAAIEASRLLGKFSEEDAMLLRLRHVEGWDLSEIAEQFDTSRRTLTRRLERLETRARAILRVPESA